MRVYWHRYVSSWLSSRWSFVLIYFRWSMDCCLEFLFCSVDAAATDCGLATLSFSSSYSSFSICHVLVLLCISAGVSLLITSLLLMYLLQFSYSCITVLRFLVVLRVLAWNSQKKHQWKLTDWVLLCSDSAPAHTCHVAMVTVHECGFRLLFQPPCFADLGPLDYQLSRYLKGSFSGRAFEDDEPVIMAVN